MEAGNLPEESSQPPLLPEPVGESGRHEDERGEDARKTTVRIYTPGFAGTGPGEELKRQCVEFLGHER